MNMKSFFTLAIAVLMVAVSASAQRYNSRMGGGSPAYRQGYNDARRADLSSRPRRSRSLFSGYDIVRPYFGLRVGPSFSAVSSDDFNLNGSSVKTGVNAGFAAGFPVSAFIPLYIETGLYYTEKGGKGNVNGNRFTYNLDYLELPFVFKYKHYFTPEFAIEPYLGGYAALGVAGKIKDFDNRSAYSSFSSDTRQSFRRGDAGLKFGCGASFSILHLDLSYDLGLADVCRDGFDASHNRAFTMSVGLTF